MAKIGFIYIFIFLFLSLIFFVSKIFFIPATPSAVNGIIGYVLNILGGIFFLLMLFCFYFFRDPSRSIIIDENKVLSPADGTVFEICEEDEPLHIKDRAKVVKIFLSVFNVHLQRAPVSGEVKFIEERKGLVLPANHKDASEKNRQNLVGITGRNPVLVKQIAGIIARKCDLWVKLNQSVKQGDKIGIIHFGSQVDIFLPKNISVNVSVGDKVTAGVTVIGERK